MFQTSSVFLSSRNVLFFMRPVFSSPYIRSQTRQPLDATIHQCSRASLRIPSWLSFTKLPPFSGLHDKFSTPLRSLFWNAHSISLGFVPSFQKLIFRIPCIVRIIFFYFSLPKSGTKRVTSAPQLWRPCAGGSTRASIFQKTSSRFSIDILFRSVFFSGLHDYLASPINQSRVENLSHHDVILHPTHWFQ